MNLLREERTLCLLLLDNSVVELLPDVEESHILCWFSVNAGGNLN